MNRILRWLFGRMTPGLVPTAGKAAKRLARVQRLETKARRAIVRQYRDWLWAEAEKAAAEGKYRLSLAKNIWPHETDAMPELAKAMEADGFLVAITREDQLGTGPGNSGELYLIKYVIALDWRVSEKAKGETAPTKAPDKKGSKGYGRS